MAKAIHVCLNVADAERAATWYCEELGFADSWAFETEGGSEHNVFISDEDGFELQLSEKRDLGGLTPGTAWDHFAIAVEDVDAAFERIDNHGVVREPTDIPTADARVAFIEDPDGHTVELVESPD